MATRPAKATGNRGASRPGAPRVPGKPARPQRQPSRRATASAAPTPAAAPGERPRALRLAAAALAVEAVGMCVAAGFAAVSTADGQSYQRASGVALTLTAVGTAVGFALFARGLAKARPWTRTPVVMTQLAIGVVGDLPAEGPPARLGRADAAGRGLLPGRPVHPASLRALDPPWDPPPATSPGPRTSGVSPRWSGPREAESGSWPAAGTRASGRCRARRRSGTGSCCRRTGAAGSSSPAAAAARAAA